MYVSKLILNHFRNYESLSLSFDAGIHLFIGQNAQGKTNILESLYVLGLAKSHRTSKDRELIQWDRQHASIQGDVHHSYGDTSLHLMITTKGKKAKANELEQQRLSNYIGLLNVVMFAPEDLALVKGSPQTRRRFLDMEIGQVSSTYMHHLSQYQKILSQRNALLKTVHVQKSNRPIIDVFTTQLIDEACAVLVRRFRFLRVLQQWSAPIHERISNGTEQLEIRYACSVDADETSDESHIQQALMEKFEMIRDQEEQRGSTLIGPHRDDIQFMINERDVQTFGSQGQQRSTALSVKLAELELIHSEIGEYPILLLDDVLSELDNERRSHLLEAMHKKVQTFVTNTSTEGVDRTLQKDAHIYTIHGGKVVRN